MPASELVLALQCGGSDGWSGVTANPGLGKACDLLVRQGGTVVLGETTEIYGAEHLLTRRASSQEVGEQLVERIRWWEGYTAMWGASIDNNPTPGNKAGGLTTIYEKSLGAVAKAGSTPLNQVVGYAERVTERGLVHMDTPGYDPSPSPARSQAAATSSRSRPAAAPPSGSSRRRRSRSRPTASSTDGRSPTWTSTPAASSPE